jgi:MFS family permease
MMRDLGMDDRMRGEAAGIFFLGYVVLQIPVAYWASRWSARKTISLCLVFWGLCAAGCGLSRTFRQFELMRFLLGVAESGVFPATLVLLASWFPSHERARANACWNLCQPLALAGSAPLTGWLLGAYGWNLTLKLEGALPFLWLPVWWWCIRDHPRQAEWLPAEERAYLERALERERAQLEPPAPVSWAARFLNPALWVMLVIYFLHNCAAYGCMTFFTGGLKGRGFTAFQYGILFALPYAVTAVIMVLNSWHSDRTRERRGHVAAVYVLSGSCLILSVAWRGHFWVSYALMCLAIPGPFAALAPFWAIPSETLPGGVMAVIIGLVNAVGNVGGYAGNGIVGWLSTRYHSTGVPFTVLGAGLLVSAALAFLLPKPVRLEPAAGGVRGEPAPAGEAEG